MSKLVITVEAVINSNINKVWEYWTKPEYVTQWCFASNDWHAPSSTCDFKVGGKTFTRMEAKNGSFGFDFLGTYDEIIINKKLAITMGDERKWVIYFSEVDGGVKVVEEFEAESENPIEKQQAGWQMILNNFKTYVENN